MIHQNDPEGGTLGDSVLNKSNSESSLKGVYGNLMHPDYPHCLLVTGTTNPPNQEQESSGCFCSCF